MKNFIEHIAKILIILQILYWNYNRFLHCICIKQTTNRKKTESRHLMAFSVNPLLFYSDSSLASLSSSCKYCVILPHALERPTTARRDTERFHTVKHTLTHAHTHTHPPQAGRWDRQLMLSVDCRSAIPLHSAPRGWITVWEQSHPNIVTGQVLVSISAYVPHCVWLFAQIDSIIAENLKENRLICYRTVSGVNQGCLSSLICCRPVVNPGTQVGLLTAMQPKKEGWI